MTPEEQQAALTPRGLTKDEAVQQLKDLLSGRITEEDARAQQQPSHGSVLALNDDAGLAAALGLKLSHETHFNA